MSLLPSELAERLDSAARRALAEAAALAELHRHGEVGPLHLLAALLPVVPELRSAVERRAVDSRLLLSFVEVTLARRRPSTPGLRPVLDERLASRLTLRAPRGRLLVPADLAAAALRTPTPELERVLTEFGLDALELAAVVEGTGGRSPEPRGEVPARAGAASAEAPSETRGEAEAPPVPTPRGTPLAPLELASVDGAAVPWTLAARAAPGRPAIVGRAAEIAAVLAVMRQRTLRCPALVGPAGCGRRTVMAEVLARLADGDGPSSAGRALPRQALAIDLVALTAGTRARGDLEDRLLKLARAIQADAEALLLCIPDASALSELTGGLGLDELLAELVERNGLRVMMVATPADLERLREKAPRLAAVFEPVVLAELSAEETGPVLEPHARLLAEHHGARLGPDAVAAAVGLSARYLREPALPARAIHLLDAAAGRAVTAGRTVVTADDVADTVSGWTRIPVNRLLRAEADRLRSLEEVLGRSIKGQDDAIARVARAVRRGRLGLRDPRRPIGSFLFAGPTGVGKTELTRKLAEALFDDPGSLIRIDMSEFGERHMVARLLGAPPGYVDSETGGVLTEAIRRRPYAVLLLDEMEKAHPDVHNLLLQLLDEGRLTDARGRVFDFTHAVVVMTTNVGGRRALEALDGDELAEKVRQDLLQVFRPEMLNRIDETVVFRPLDDAALRGVARLALDDAAAVARPLEVVVRATAAVEAWLVARRDNPEFGARPVRRIVRREVLDRLAEGVIDGSVRAGDTVTFDVEGETLAFRVERPAPPTPSPGPA